MSDDPPPTIFGWTPTGSAITAGGVVIAILVGSISMIASEPLAPKLNWLFAGTILLLLGSIIARLIWGKAAPQLTPAIMIGVMLKLANLVAIALLGLTALAAFAIGYGRWTMLTNAFVFDLVLGVLLHFLTAIVSNVSAVLPSWQPPSRPPA